MTPSPSLSTSSTICLALTCAVDDAIPVFIRLCHHLPRLFQRQFLAQLLRTNTNNSTSFVKSIG